MIYRDVFHVLLLYQRIEEVSVRSADTFTRKQIWRATTEVRSLPCLSLNTLLNITWLDSKVPCAVLVKQWLNYVYLRDFVLSS